MGAGDLQLVPYSNHAPADYARELRRYLNSLAVPATAEILVVHLNDDLVGVIAGYCHADALVHLGTVAKSWHDISCRERYWAALLLRDFGISVAALKEHTERRRAAAAAAATMRRRAEGADGTAADAAEQGKAASRHRSAVKSGPARELYKQLKALRDDMLHGADVRRGAQRVMATSLPQHAFTAGLIGNSYNVYRVMRYM